MKILEQYGWSHQHDILLKQYADAKFLPGRVISIKGHKYVMITTRGELEAELSGKLLFSSFSEELPVVGDWVLYLDYDTTGYIVEVLPRKNALSRKEPGTRSGTQVLAANIDAALIVQGLDRDFNPRRIDRYIVQIISCGIIPVVVLNKVDLTPHPDDYVAKVRELKRECDVFLCSTFTGEGIREIREKVLRKGTTNIFVGSSGVGKSSLLNTFMEDTMQVTNVISEASGKGKHTTTTRDLYKMSNGALIIDTPGMREFGLASDDAMSSDELFPAIAAYASNCRFKNCTHINEISCAVKDAVATGKLSEDTYGSYVKLMKEQKHFQMNAEDKKRAGKRMGKIVKEAKEFKKRYKGG